jgi:UDP-glucose 4-epimerase
VRGGTLVIHGRGDQTRDFVYLDDVVEAMVAAATVPTIDRQVINVGSGVPTSIRALAQQVLEVVGSKAEWLYKESQEAGTDSMCADVALASHKLGFSPRVRLKDGLGRMIARDPRFQAGRSE